MPLLLAMCQTIPTIDWPVHDPERPFPPVIEGAQAVSIAPPADAVVLFDGSNLDHWRSGDGSPAPWKIEGTDLVVEPGTGILQTAEGYGDVQLHIEWMVPESMADKQGQSRGNSGVFFMGQYEVQVLESRGSTTYADGMAAALYGQHPPTHNVGAGIGQWNSYDIFFQAPRFD
ncbi:MAG: DUF1080 domain-containing protein, partial [Planctomycetota bacterium]